MSFIPECPYKRFPSTRLRKTRIWGLHVCITKILINLYRFGNPAKTSDICLSTYNLNFCTVLDMDMSNSLNSSLVCLWEHTEEVGLNILQKFLMVCWFWNCFSFQTVIKNFRSLPAAAINFVLVGYSRNLQLKAQPNLGCATLWLWF